MSIRDDIRTKTLGTPKIFRSKKFMYNGIEVEFKQPSVKIRKEIYAKSLVPSLEKDGEPSIDLWHFLLWSVITCTFVPDTKEQIFEEADFDVMLEEPTGSFVDEFGGEVQQIMNIAIDDAEKNLNAIPID